MNATMHQKTEYLLSLLSGKESLLRPLLEGVGGPEQKDPVGFAEATRYFVYEVKGFLKVADMVFGFYADSRDQNLDLQELFEKLAALAEFIVKKSRPSNPDRVFTMKKSLGNAVVDRCKRAKKIVSDFEKLGCVNSGDSSRNVHVVYEPVVLTSEGSEIMEKVMDPSSPFGKVVGYKPGRMKERPFPE